MCWRPSPSVCCPAHISPEDAAGLHRLGKNPQHHPADVEAPQLPHKIEMARTHPAEQQEVLDQSSQLCMYVPGTYYSRRPKGNINSIPTTSFYFCFLPKISSIYKTDLLLSSLKQISMSYYSTKWRTSSGQISRLKVLNNIT